MKVVGFLRVLRFPTTGNVGRVGWFKTLFHSSQKGDLLQELSSVQLQLKALAGSLRVGFCDEWFCDECSVTRHESSGDCHAKVSLESLRLDQVEFRPLQYSQLQMIRDIRLVYTIKASVITVGNLHR